MTPPSAFARLSWRDCSNFGRARGVHEAMTEIAAPPLSTTDRPRIAAGPASEPEAAVFAARGELRPRSVRFAGRALCALVALWVVALLAGALGIDLVPGLRFPGAHHATKAAANVRERPLSPFRAVAASAGARLSVRFARIPEGGAARSLGTHRGAAHPAVTAKPTGRLPSPAATLGLAVPTSGRPAAAGGASSSNGAGYRSAASPRAGGSANSKSSHAGSGSSPASGSPSQASTAPGRAQSPATPAPGTRGESAQHSAAGH